MKLTKWFPESVVLTAGWFLMMQQTEWPLFFRSYADVLSAFVLLVFIQFLYQAHPPKDYRNYLILAYSAFAIGFIFFGIPEVNLAISGYLIILSLSFIFRHLLTKTPQ